MALRTPLPVQPNLYMTDAAGRPLDGGKVYFGESGKDPELYPIDIFYDEALTIAAPQPVTTKNGFLSASGNIIAIYGTADSYSVKVLDANSVQVLYLSSMTNSDSFVALLDAEIARSTQEAQVIKQDLSAINTDLTQTKSALEAKNAELQNQINANGGGKFAYVTYAEMEIAAALPVEDPDKLPAKSSIDIVNDPDANKNGTYAYDGATFTESLYDPLTLSKGYTDTAKTAILSRAKSSLQYGISPETLGATNGTGLSTQITKYNGLSDIWVEQGKYIDSGGVVVTTTSPIKLSDFLAVGQGDKIDIEYSITSPISTYDKDLNFIATLASGEQVPFSHIISDPLVRFIRVCLGYENGYNQKFNITKGYKEIAWLKIDEVSMLDGLKNIFDANDVAGENLLASASFTDGYYLDGDGTPVAYGTYSYSDYVPVIANETYIVSLASTFAGIWYDADKNIIESLAGGAGGGTYDHRVLAPTGAAFVRVNIVNSDAQKSFSIVTNKLIIPMQGVVNETPMSIWEGKKIAWYGTSIPVGYPNHATTELQDIWSHANLAVHDLGAEIINKAVPSGGVRYTLAPDLSFTNLSGATNYQNALIDLFGTADDPDLVVFDYGVNDYPSGDNSHLLNFDPSDPYDELNTGKSKITDQDINTFIGAYNIVIINMLIAKPTQRFCFITHFSDDYTQGKDFFALLNQTIEALAEEWQAPVLRLQRKTNFRQRNNLNSITPLMPDNIHPASGDGRAVQSLRAIMRHFLISIG